MYQGGHGLMYYVPGSGQSTKPGQRILTWGYYLQVPESTLASVLVDDQERQQSSSVPFGKVHPQVRAAVAPRSYARDRLCPAGGAGAVFPPFTGSGVLKAVVNATSLVDALAGAPAVDDALHQWSQAQLQVAAQVMPTAELPQLVWLNQYANLANIRAHKERTAKAIHRELGEIDALFVGVGTTGTLMGCLEYFSENSPRTRVVAVDAVGSVTFGGSPAPRFIPGLGTSRRPEIFTDSDAFEKVHIEEIDAIATCRMLAARYGLLVGGSTGTVLAAVRLLTPTLRSCRRIVAISPDMGDKYLDTVYSDTWVAERYAGILDLSGLGHPIAS
jgi:hypothetical protein